METETKAELVRQKRGAGEWREGEEGAEQRAQRRKGLGEREGQRGDPWGSLNRRVWLPLEVCRWSQDRYERLEGQRST